MGIALRGPVRAVAVASVAALAMLVPGVGPLAAHSAVGAQDGDRPPWAPPPPRQEDLPSDTEPKDLNLKHHTQCIAAAFEDLEEIDASELPNIPWGQQHLRLDEVHSYVRSTNPDGLIGAYSKKKPIKVAVIDTGVTAHNFLPPGRLTGGGDYIEVDKDGQFDCDGHGTQVAGIIAASHDRQDEIGFIGVAPDAHIVSIRQSSANFAEKTPEELAKEEEDRQKEEELKEREREAEEQARQLEDRQRQLEEEQRRLEEEQQQRDKDDDDDNGGGASNTADTAPLQAEEEGDGDKRGQNELGGAGTRETLAQAIVRAVDEHEVDVINMSVDACRPNFSPPGQPIGPVDDERQLQAAVRYAVDSDVVVVTAAGNVSGSCVQNSEQTEQEREAGIFPDPNNPRTIVTPPWFAEDLLVVGAIDQTGGVADFSMHGPWVNVAAPGTEVISLDPAEGANGLVNLTFESNGGDLVAVPLQGTSFAAPYVAGLAVLVRQLHPELNAREVMNRIMATAQHPGADGGRDQFLGYGVIDPMAALTATLPEDIEGLERAEDRQLPTDIGLVPPEDQMPKIVAIGGSLGAIGALFVTMFVIRTVRRRLEPEAQT